MRSWTTFIVFGLILIALILFWSLSQHSTASNPVMRTAQEFLDAVKTNDASAASKLIDRNMGKVVSSGNYIARIDFAETSKIISSAFSKQEAVAWDYLSLSGLALDLNAKPTILEEEGLARAPLVTGQAIYLHRVDGAWKIFYITKGSINK